jgi:hypothetical protein
MQFEKDEKLMGDIKKLINDVKILQQASAIYDNTKTAEAVQNFQQDTLRNLEGYLSSARALLKK